MKKLIMAICMMIALTFTFGCSSVGAIQGAAEHYSVELSGNANGLLGANLRFIAVDGTFGGVLKFRRDLDTLWERRIDIGSGRRAFQIIFDNDDNFIDVVESTWEAASSSLTWLPK